MNYCRKEDKKEKAQGKEKAVYCKITHTLSMGCGKCGSHLK
jgi:hypothetical protein